MPQIDDDRVRDALREVIDPELGLNIVDLGMVYRASATDDAIEIAFTLTTPSCPLGEYMIEQIREVLGRAFPQARDIRVDLVWEPRWTPAQMSESMRQLLG